MKRVISGMRPTGRLHLGNLEGALKNWVKLQDSNESFFMVADLHALTTEYANSKEIGLWTREMVIDWVSMGIDPEKSVIFVQSNVPAHAELHLILSMITPVPWLERCPTYKEQIQALVSKDLSTYGFLGYPVLQSADILIYKGELVPVGEDQLPHLELSREIARRFNYLYKEVFPEPEALLTEFPKVPGVDGRKMSKSYDNAIYLSDSPDIVEQKLKTMMTDPARKRRTDAGDPGLSPVYQLHKIFSSKEEQEEVAHGCRTAGIGCIDCKKILIKNVFKIMEPIWDRRNVLLNNPDLLYDAAKKGTDKAGKVIRETMELVRDAMGVGGF